MVGSVAEFIRRFTCLAICGWIVLTASSDWSTYKGIDACVGILKLHLILYLRLALKTALGEWYSNLGEVSR